MKSLLKNLLPAFVQRNIRRFLTVWRERTYPKRTVTHLYQGQRLMVLLADRQAKEWYDHDSDYPEIDLLVRQGLRSGHRVFELGAHQGVVAMILSRIVGSSGAVLAVESDPRHAQIAKTNLELNRISNARILCAAVMEASGSVRVNSNGQIDSGDANVPEVVIPSYSVDDLAAEYGRPDLVYLDVEGFEERVLRGAEKTLQDCPLWMVEVHKDAGLEAAGGSVAKILDFFRGFTLFAAPCDTQEPLVRLSSELEVRSHLVAARSQT